VLWAHIQGPQIPDVLPSIRSALLPCALLLFASIQISMILYGLTIGERLSGVQWVGLACAVGGLVVLMLPRLGAPPLTSAALMVISGIAWGAYSLLGRGTTDPIAATAGNFVRATPCAT